MSKKKVISFRILLVSLLKRHLKDDFRAKGANIFIFFTIFRAKTLQKSNFFQNFTHILLLKQHSGDDRTKGC